uniref:Ras-associating domain-containing protein n=1 Tax=Macrostomum lignano TaxID=282301 RepID=A0A1I8FHW2_9PLAT
QRAIARLPRLAAVEPQPHQAGRAVRGRDRLPEAALAPAVPRSHGGGGDPEAAAKFKRLHPSLPVLLDKLGAPDEAEMAGTAARGAEGLGAGVRLRCKRADTGESRKAPAGPHAGAAHLIAFIRKAFRLPPTAQLSFLYLCDNMPGIESTHGGGDSRGAVLQYRLWGHDPGQVLMTAEMESFLDVSMAGQLKIPNAKPWFPGEQLQFAEQRSESRSKDRRRRGSCCIVNKQPQNLWASWLRNGNADRLLGRFSCHWQRQTPGAIRWALRSICLSATREMNAIMNKNSADVRDCTPVRGPVPLQTSAPRSSLQSGITRWLYLSDK